MRRKALLVISFSSGKKPGELSAHAGLSRSKKLSYLSREKLSEKENTKITEISSIIFSKEDSSSTRGKKVKKLERKYPEDRTVLKFLNKLLETNII